MPGLTIQIASSAADLPDLETFRLWVDLAREGHLNRAGEVTIRIVDEPESAQLNQQYRHKQGPTNVLSFPVADLDMPLPPDSEPELGDLVICAPLVGLEAKEQQKSVSAHWAHLTLHGLLHLCGFDHQTDDEQLQMETLEISLLQQIDIENPYLMEDMESP
ncbi:MAG: rRNA maturation RNase YbeY [Gammaproteobacteria bacterium]|nr:MAG: rRNA maturation RNase YbeY [Gammaproteobacteria bacterium]RLA14499.1 MAG: rRNA maturation RNase YbeY [Gammaproteobacteria bacterium]RLA16759.1 MAG: rRNA maturation RNase YbeY [Gammaproteobacteria bacterium]